MAGAGRARQASHETAQRVTRPYVLRGRLYCGFCDRRMQGQYNHGVAYYRCRYPKEYALANHVRHPGNVYLREADVAARHRPAGWSAIFAPHRLDQTIREIARSPAPPPRPPSRRPRPRYRGTSSPTATPSSPATRPPSTPAATRRPSPRWTRQVEADRAAALARDATQARHQPGRRLTADNIRALITSLGDLRDVIRDADPADKTAIYDQLGLKVTFKPGEAKIRAEVTIGPENYLEHAQQCGDTGRVRGGT